MKQTRKERKTEFYEAFLGLFLRLMGVVGGWWGREGGSISQMCMFDLANTFKCFSTWGKIN